MSVAILEAKKAYLINEVPVGAVLVDNKTNSIITSSFNSIIRKNNPIKHAEMNLIEKTCSIYKSKYLSNTSIFITLEPCAMCAAAISEVRINRIYFGAYDEKKGSLESIMKIYNNKNYFVPEVYGGINEIECSEILVKFFKEKRKNFG